MTQPESALIEAQRKLDGIICQCGGYATIGWDGCLYIACDDCGKGAAVADFEPEEVLKLWAERNKAAT